MPRNQRSTRQSSSPSPWPPPATPCGHSKRVCARMGWPACPTTSDRRHFRGSGGTRTECSSDIGRLGRAESDRSAAAELLADGVPDAVLIELLLVLLHPLI